MATKITKKDNFSELRALALSANRPDLVDFIDHEVELLSKKSSTKKPTKNQQANAVHKDNIVGVMVRLDRPVTCSELCAEPEFEGFTPQKMSALLHQLEKEGEVHTVPDKKRTLFALGAGDEE